MPILTRQEQHQLFTVFNNTSVPIDEEQTIVDRFEAGGAVGGSRIVAACEERALTWGQLNRRANRLAHNLLEVCPLGADDLVCMLLRRSERMMESILAIWKCGAAYVPLDLDYPLERIRSVIADSGAKVVITENRAAGH